MMMITMISIIISSNYFLKLQPGIPSLIMSTYERVDTEYI